MLLSFNDILCFKKLLICLLLPHLTRGARNSASVCKAAAMDAANQRAAFEIDSCISAFNGQQAVCFCAVAAFSSKCSQIVVTIVHFRVKHHLIFI